MARVKFMKNKWFPRPHFMQNSWSHSMEVADQHSTIYPLIHYDEGLGTPSDYEANPENANFVRNGMPNCYPDSRIDLILSKLDFSLTKGALHTDNVDIMKMAFMVIKLAFKEDYIAIDELSTFETQDVLEVTTEATDRQGYPLWNGTKLTEKFTNSALLNTQVPGLTTTQVMEGVDFKTNDYYNLLHYMTNRKKLMALQRGLKWFTISRDRPHKTFKIKIDPKVKAMNEYTQFGVLIHCPQVDSHDQFVIAGDVTAIPHVNVQMSCRYNEWNENFNMKLV